jgi:hypothetical protein
VILKPAGGHSVEAVPSTPSSSQYSNPSSVWLFGGPEFESRTALHYYMVSGMPVYFWEQVGTCSPDVGASNQGVHFEELTREDHPFCPVKVYCNCARGFLTMSRVSKATAKINTPTSLERHFQWCYEFHRYKNESLVSAPKDKGKPATKFDSSHLQIIYNKY